MLANPASGKLRQANAMHLRPAKVVQFHAKKVFKNNTKILKDRNR